MISLVCWLWRQPGRQPQYTAEHVNILRRMIARNYRAPQRFICVTNEPGNYDAGVEIVPDRCDFADVPSPHGRGAPSCYRRLRLFAPDAAETFGEQIVSIDLDCVIVRDLTPLWDRPEPFVCWRDPLYGHQLCGSMFMLRAGTHPRVWSDFDPKTSPAEAAAAGYRGSDQAWISYTMGWWTPRWTPGDGVWSFRVDLAGGSLPLLDHARVVFFHGAAKPWNQATQIAWVREHYR